MQTHFWETKRRFKKVIQAVSKDGKGRNDLLEAAFFAYAHRNPVIDLIFWDRLRVAERAVLAQNPRSVLDFGSGSGVMSYCLALSDIQVIGADPDQRPLGEVRKHISFPPTIEFIDPKQLDESQFDNSFDVILALDVLEHITDLTDFVTLAKRVLKPDGQIIVSGPTENILYQIGRKIAGKQFHGGYHVSNIHLIRDRLAQDFNITHLRTIYPFLPLFELFAASKR